MERLEGTIESIVFRNDENGWTVAVLKPEGAARLSAVGVMPFLKAGECVVLNGEITEHRDYGKQFKVLSYEVTRPQTVSSIEKYLSSGVIRGIGPATAKLILKHFGSKALDVMESTPARLTEISGIGPKRAAMIAESFSEQNESRMTLIYLQNLGLSPTMAMKVYRAFGEATESLVKSNPYRLADEIEGIGFQTADSIAQRMGISVNDPGRLASGVRYVLSEAVARMGHIFLPYDELVRQSCGVLNTPMEISDSTIRKLIIDGKLICENIGENRAVYLPVHYKAEKETAERLAALARFHMRNSIDLESVDDEIAKYEHENKVRLSEKQKEAVFTAVSNGIIVITGGPGTGKTTSINCILHLLSGKKVELCAPTGRAAKRMSEATGKEARTIHRMLEYSGESESFAKDEKDPIKADVIIVDEMSMVDIFLMRALLRAIPKGTRLILVGDADQLPSVGAGNVLRDIIESGVVNVVRLDMIFRQGAQSCIVTNAHRINHGEYPEIRTKDTDFFLERKETAQSVSDSVLALVNKRLPGYLNVDRLQGIQVMSPMKKGALGVLEMNRILQEELNPADFGKSELKRADCIFRKGDKIMQVRNNYDIEWVRGIESGQGIYNGDIGYIRDIDMEERSMQIEFDDGRLAEYEDSMLEELELSYCISVHKSQGSEFDAVVLPLLNGPQMLMCRNLLYTAVTRAKRLVVIVGREECIKRMVDNNRIFLRYSALKERLKGQVSG